MYEIFQGIISNPIFGGSVLVAVMYTLRQLPDLLIKFIFWRFSTSLQIYNDDPIYEPFVDWMKTINFHHKSRSFRIASSDDAKESKLVPGIGSHLFIYKSILVCITRSLPPPTSISWKRREDFSIHTYGINSSKRMNVVIDDIINSKFDVELMKVPIFGFTGYWTIMSRKEKRSLDSVILPDGQMDRLLNDIQRFKDSKKTYTKHGIPYRRGILLEGPPGCGKTSIVLALASHFNKPVFVINLGGIKGDNEFIGAVSLVPENAILLIEDIDATNVTESRDVKPDTKPESTSRIDLEKAVEANELAKPVAKNISLSCLLNSIDGPFSRDGRILIMTTNHPDKIDPALLRPGRVDLKEHIGMLTRNEITKMCVNFLGEVNGLYFSNKIEEPISPAELQNMLLKKVHQGSS